jgi:sugar lactone lactonase YvrE
MNLKATVAIDSQDNLGEGPFWQASLRRLIWSDISAGVVHEAKFEGTAGWQETRRWELRRHIGAALPRDKGGLVVVCGTEIVFLDDEGEITPFARLDADPNLVAFNDAKCDSRGRLWAGTSATDLRSRRGSLYRIDPDGKIAMVLDRVTLSNGLDWSPDEATFYYIDSSTRTVDAFDFDVIRGSIGNRRTIVEIPAGGGLFDGMAVDREGCIWVAVAGVGEIRRYAPDGLLLGCVTVPAPFGTSCAFGGRDGGLLFITSVKMDYSDEVLMALEQFGLNIEDAKKRTPTSGSLFVCKPGVTGRPATPFGG